MKKQKDKSKKKFDSDDYFVLSIAIGLILGMIFNQIVLGIIFGCTAGIILSNDRGNKGE